MNMVQTLAGLAAPWQALYSDSLAISTTVTTVHILSLVAGGGLAIAADRTTLRALRRPQGERGLHLGELRAVHRPVVLALAVLFVSGLLLALADVETFAVSKLFWVKMAMIAALLVNGASLYRTEKRLAHVLPAEAEEDQPLKVRLWRRLGRRAWTSLGLWLLVAVLGTVLTNVG